MPVPTKRTWVGRHRFGPLAVLLLIEYRSISARRDQGHSGMLLEIAVDLTLAVAFAVHEAEREIHDVESKPGLWTNSEHSHRVRSQYEGRDYVGDIDPYHHAVPWATDADTRCDCGTLPRAEPDGPA